MKENVVEIGNHRYRYGYDSSTKRTVYLGPVGDGPELSENEFLKALATTDLTPELIIDDMVEAYGEEDINLWNCHQTAWRLMELYRDRDDLTVVLGVAPLFQFGPEGYGYGPYFLPHSWVETPDYIIDTNPEQVAYHETDYWLVSTDPDGEKSRTHIGWFMEQARERGSERLLRQQGMEQKLNLKVISKSDPSAKGYYRGVGTAFQNDPVAQKRFKTPKGWSDSFTGLPLESEFGFTLNRAGMHLFKDDYDRTENQVKAIYDMILDGKIVVDWEHLKISGERIEKRKQERKPKQLFDF